jgi:hypothetical protein
MSGLGPTISGLGGGGGAVDILPGTPGGGVVGGGAGTLPRIDPLDFVVVPSSVVGPPGSMVPVGSFPPTVTLHSPISVVDGHPHFPPPPLVHGAGGGPGGVVLPPISSLQTPVPVASISKDLPTKRSKIDLSERQSYLESPPDST